MSQLLAFLPIGTIETTIYELLRDSMPPSAYFLLMDIIDSITSVENNSSGIISLGSILALIFASNGVHSLITEFGKNEISTTQVVKKQNYFQQRWIAMQITLLLVLILLLTVAVLIIGEIYLDRFLETIYVISQFSYYILALFKWLMVLLLVLNLVSSIYFWAPQVKHKWSYFSVGSMTATLLIILSSYLFTYYTVHFSSYNLLYGSIGALMIFMFWIYLNSLMLLIGFEMNIAIEQGNNLLLQENKQAAEV